MNLRRIALAVFALATSLVVACGHQVTPSPTFSDLAGDIVLKFRVNGTLDFNDFTYAVIIDTCGNGTPYPEAYKTTYNSYSYGFFIGASFGTGLPQLVEYFVNPNSNNSITYVTVPASSSLEQFIPNDNGQGNEFELVFSRAQLDNPLNQAQPCPNIPPVKATATPTAAAGASPSATPTSLATVAGASPSPSPTPTPNPNPTTAAQASWAFNFFTIQSGIVQDSLGQGGATDNNYNGAIINTNQTYDTPVYKTIGGNGAPPPNPAAQLSGGDIQNYQ
jgi:hypothetical protein